MSKHTEDACKANEANHSVSYNFNIWQKMFNKKLNVS